MKDMLRPADGLQSLVLDFEHHRLETQTHNDGIALKSKSEYCRTAYMFRAHHCVRENRHLIWEGWEFRQYLDHPDCKLGNLS